MLTDSGHLFLKSIVTVSTWVLRRATEAADSVNVNLEAAIEGAKPLAVIGFRTLGSSYKIARFLYKSQAR